MLYVPAPVLVRVISDGSGHDSAEIDGAVERHASTLMQPVPALHHSNIKTSTNQSDLQLDLKNINSNLDFTANPAVLKCGKRSHEEEKFIIDQENIESKKEFFIDDNKMVKDMANKENMESKIPEIQNCFKSNEFCNKSKDQVTRQSETYSQDNRMTKKAQIPIDLTPYMKYSITTTEFTESMTLDNYEESIEDSTTGSASKLQQAESASLKEQIGKEEKQDYWRSMSSSSESRVPAELWETQFSIDISPCSGNEESYVKNISSRQGTISDTDSDGSPNRRRRSPGKRRTLGSSSGSDVALHEGAELSPMEDDQGTSITAKLLSKQCTYPADQSSMSDMSSHQYMYNYHYLNDRCIIVLLLVALSY